MPFGNNSASHPAGIQANADSFQDMAPPSRKLWVDSGIGQTAASRLRRQICIRCEKINFKGSLRRQPVLLIFAIGPNAGDDLQRLLVQLGFVDTRFHSTTRRTALESER